jgi:hypothetical protein
MQFPDTPLVMEAMRSVENVLSQALLRHSQRAFLLGRAYAQQKRIAFDEEALLLAALFHDVGLSDSWADRTRAFTEIGAEQIRRFMTDHAQVARGAHLADAISFHMQLMPRWSKGPVAGLLQVGAWMDASGLRKHSIGREKRLDIETAFPRAGFDAEFLVRFRTALGSPRACLRLLFPPTYSGWERAASSQSAPPNAASALRWCNHVNAPATPREPRPRPRHSDRAPPRRCR